MAAFVASSLHNSFVKNEQTNIKIHLISKDTFMDPSNNLLKYSKLNERETEIVKKQVKSQYERLKFRKYASLAHLNPSSGSYKEKLKRLFAEEIETERGFYVYVYNMLRPQNLINANDMRPQNLINANAKNMDPNDKFFTQGLRIGQLADRLKDSLWHTKKRLAETTKLMQNALELLEDQVGDKDRDKDLVKNTIIDMINNVCTTKISLLDEVLKEDEKPLFDFSALNPFNSPLKIKLVQENDPISVKINGGKRIRKTQKRR